MTIHGYSMYVVVSEKGLPSSVDFMRCESNRMVAGYTSANAYLFDIETSQKILDFDFKAEGMLHIMSVCGFTCQSHTYRQLRHAIFVIKCALKSNSFQ